MKKHGSLFVVALALLSISIAFAGEPAGPPQPTPEHKALEIWVGTWTGSAEMKPGPLGPGGPISWTEECSWFGGAGFHVFCESKGSGPTGPTQGIGIMGYNAQKKVYTHYGIDSDGWSGGGEGTRSGDSWTFLSAEMMGGKTLHGRYTMTFASPTRVSFKYEMSEDGKNWTLMMEGVTERK